MYVHVYNYMNNVCIYMYTQISSKRLIRMCIVIMPSPGSIITNTYTYICNIDVYIPYSGLFLGVYISRIS